MKWKALKADDIIDIIAPSSALVGDEKKLLAEVKNFIEELGFVPRIPEGLIINSEELLQEGYDPFCANTDHNRLRYLLDAVYAEDSKVIWALRGGYGCTRLISGLEKSPLPRKAKLLIGFSDITALHLYFQQKWGWASLHAKVLSQFTLEKRDEQSVNEIKQILFGIEKLHFKQLTPINEEACNAGRIIDTVITGGNLCIVETSIATVWQIESKDKIIFLEDIGERGYRIDRSLEHLSQAGIFNHASAVIFGDFTEGQEKNGVDYIPYALKRFAMNIGIPVLQIKNIGHSQINHPLPLNCKASLLLGENPELICETGASFEH